METRLCPLNRSEIIITCQFLFRCKIADNFIFLRKLLHIWINRVYFFHALKKLFKITILNNFFVFVKQNYFVEPNKFVLGPFCRQIEILLLGQRNCIFSLIKRLLVQKYSFVSSTKSFSFSIIYLRGMERPSLFRKLH